MIGWSFLLGRNRTEIDAGTSLIEGFGESQFLSSMLALEKKLLITRLHSAW
jgi:hypothetical protein